MVEIERHEIGIEDSVSFSPDWKGGQQMGSVCIVESRSTLRNMEVWRTGQLCLDEMMG